MMAFFLLMWLIGSTTKGDLEGIAEFFRTPLKVALAGGSGSGDSSSVIQGGGQDLTRSAGQVQKADTPAKRQTINLQAARAELARREIEKLAGLEEALRGRDRQGSEARAVQEPDPARDHARRIADHGRRRAEPRDVRHRQRAAEGLHARHHARDRRAPERRRQRDLARRPHRLEGSTRAASAATRTGSCPPIAPTRRGASSSPAA